MEQIPDDPWSCLQAALKNDSRWAILQAIRSNLQVTNRALKAITHRSPSTIARSKRLLKALGLIDFDPRGDGPSGTIYRVASPAAVKAILHRAPHCGTKAPHCGALPPPVTPMTGGVMTGGVTVTGGVMTGGVTSEIDDSAASGQIGILESETALNSSSVEIEPTHGVHAYPSKIINTSKVESGSGENWNRTDFCLTPPPFEDHFPELLSNDPTMDQSSLPDDSFLDDFDTLQEFESWIDSLIESHLEVSVHPNQPLAPAPGPTPWLLCIDPGSTTVGWCTFDASGRYLSSGDCNVPGGKGPTHASDRIVEAGKITRRLIELHRPAAVILENPDYQKPMSKHKREVMLKAFEHIRYVITIRNVPLKLLPASRHKTGKDETHALFHKMVGQPGAEDEADAWRLGHDHFRGIQSLPPL